MKTLLSSLASKLTTPAIKMASPARLAGICLLQVLLISFSESASATSFFIAPLGGGNLSFTTANFGVDEVGQRFSIGSPITIVALGLFDDLSNGFVNTTNAVGIYRVSDQALMVSTGIVSADPINQSIVGGGFRFRAVTPTLLTAGSYFVAAYMPNEKLSGGFAAGPGIAMTGIGTSNAGSLVYPSGPGLGMDSFYGTVVGGNFEYNLGDTTVPEPSSYALLLTGLGALRLVVRRRRT